MREPILEINNLSVSFFTRHGEIPAVMDFSMTVHAGEAMGLVGESGCGKSTVALAIMRYLGGNGRITEGSIRFRGREMTEMTGAELRELRGSQISMIYQEPMASLNPAMRVGLQLMEVPLSHEYISIEEAAFPGNAGGSTASGPGTYLPILPTPNFWRATAADCHCNGSSVSANFALTR